MPITQESEKLRYCLYAKKSSEADEKQALSIDSQISEMHKIVEYEGIQVVDTLIESKSAKVSGQRVVYNKLLDGVSSGKYNAILTWAPDRLSRNAGDLGSIVDMMDEGKLCEIRTHGQTFTNNPNEKFLLMILCSQAKLENDNRVKNVKRGLRKRCEMGVRPGCVPLGYELIRGRTVHERSTIHIDPVRGPYVQKLFSWVANGELSGKQAWEAITEEGFRTKTGKKLSLSMIYRIFVTSFYYGEFEYPKGSGNHYVGTHTPLVSKEVYEKAHESSRYLQEVYGGVRTSISIQYYNVVHVDQECLGKRRSRRMEEAMYTIDVTSIEENDTVMREVLQKRISYKNSLLG